MRKAEIPHTSRIAASLRKNGLDTSTSSEQEECELNCATFFAPFSLLGQDSRAALVSEGFYAAPADGGGIRLMREWHVRYILKGLVQLSSGYSSLDASRPWLCYWMLHSLDLLGALPLDACTRAQIESGAISS